MSKEKQIERVGEYGMGVRADEKKNEKLATEHYELEGQKSGMYSIQLRYIISTVVFYSFE